MTLIAASARRRNPAPEFPTSAPYNVPDHLFIPTYDGSNQPVHPDVIDFHNEPVEGDTWNGWRFWMVMTPYPNQRDFYENPSLLVSQDGINWQVPPGLTNPLYFPVGAYNNDPDLVYDPSTDEIVLFYRDFSTWKMAASSDGITWPETPQTIQETISVSPSILRDESGTWHRWLSTGRSTAPSRSGPWTPASTQTGLPAAWHFNVSRGPGGYYWIGHLNSAGTNYMQVASSANGDAWSANPNPVLVSGSHAWSELDLYRAALTLHEDGNRFRVWYSGKANSAIAGQVIWRMGYTEIPLTEWPAIP